MYVLDTNVVSELRKSPTKINPAVQDWVTNQHTHQLYITSITVYELEVGIRRLARKDLRQADTLNQWLHEALLPNFKQRILPLDTDSALIAATYQVPDPRPSADCYIAAITERNRMKLVTRNLKDFQAMSIPLVNPWEPVETIGLN